MALLFMKGMPPIVMSDRHSTDGDISLAKGLAMGIACFC